MAVYGVQQHHRGCHFRPPNLRLKPLKTTLETSGEDVKTTLETSGEDVKTTLETSREDLELHSKRVEKM